MKFATSLLISLLTAAAMATPVQERATTDTNPLDGRACQANSGVCKSGKCIVDGKTFDDDKCTNQLMGH
ncbi:hypothetical protein MCOR25_005917 [Pyricularia grisea]|uniref:Antifungal protein n=1 Tax=Pyricularia grisea TaxID=148305 RepID=A0A6P8B0X7_PYRGI|nr:uncharacterized protein PgNI_07687 [Pyricularia grisea]KAI6363425.1 hypothetical protein MCOR25_005917 [Pyricularia grisea]TLD08373.1 hypothetical protein PgNI_07687 [Pyricularia grisea]